MYSSSTKEQLFRRPSWLCFTGSVSYLVFTVLMPFLLHIPSSPSRLSVSLAPAAYLSSFPSHSSVTLCLKLGHEPVKMSASNLVLKSLSLSNFRTWRTICSSLWLWEQFECFLYCTWVFLCMYLLKWFLISCSASVFTHDRVRVSVRTLRSS